MPEFAVTIKAIKAVTHDVKSFVVEKPAGYSFEPGQATEVAINKPGWQTEARPFTFTSLPTDPDLEFTIKIYRDHQGVTNQLDSLNVGDQLLLHDVWGAIRYDGPGLFLAGGAGLTPFLAIFRSLAAKNQLQGSRLLYANKTWADVIHRQELETLLGSDLELIFSSEGVEGYPKGRITKDLIAPRLVTGQPVYLCGPDEFMESLKMQLKDLGVPDKNLILEL